MRLLSAVLRPAALPSALAAVVLVLSACTPSVGEQDAVQRGDRLFAGGELDEALAEYRLALLQGREDPEVYARAAHTYARLSRVDDAADHYAEAVALDSAWADQAVSDLVELARGAAERNDLYGVASAMQRALEFRPGLSVGELALPLARHYAQSGEFGRALPFFQRALAAVPADSAPEVMYETALAYEELGDCGRAVVFYEQYREVQPGWRSTDVDWHLGNCAYRYGRELVEEGRRESALRHLETTVEIGEPRSVLSRAHYQRGRILSLLGSCAEAVEAYRQVAVTDVAGTGSLVSRAERRIDEIRFGGHLDTFDPEARCGLPDDEVPPPPPDSLPSVAPPGDSLPGLPDEVGTAATEERS